MRATLFAAVFIMLAACCCALQSGADSCVRHDTWHPNYHGRHAPACQHVRTSLSWLLQLRRSGDNAAFAASAWNWIDEASACIFAVAHGLTAALDRIDLENLKRHHSIVLRLALAADRSPLELPHEACAQYAVDGSKSNLKAVFSQVQGMWLHPKLRSKLFTWDASAMQGQGRAPSCLLRTLFSCLLPLVMRFLRDSMRCALQVRQLPQG